MTALSAPIPYSPSGKETAVVLFAIWPWVATLLNVVVLLLSLFLILLVLIQRGKGGGLAGAFGGVGGSSAFGSRAGDLFTKITIGVATVWLILTMAQVIVVQDVARNYGGTSTIDLVGRDSGGSP
jgi:preprotein translocase subunit SecG